MIIDCLCRERNIVHPAFIPGIKVRHILADPLCPDMGKQFAVNFRVNIQFRHFYCGRAIPIKIRIKLLLKPLPGKAVANLAGNDPSLIVDHSVDRILVYFPFKPINEFVVFLSSIIGVPGSSIVKSSQFTTATFFPC